jgi:HEAT repeat protein
MADASKRRRAAALRAAPPIHRLLVDENKDVRDSAKQILKKLGLSPEEVRESIDASKESLRKLGHEVE